MSAAAIAAGMWPSRNRRVVNKQRHGCTSTKDLCLSVRVSERKVHRQLAIEFRQWRRRQGVTTGLVLFLVTVPLSAELIFGLD